MLNAEDTASREGAGLDERSTEDEGIRHPDDQEQLIGGPSFTASGVVSGGSIMNTWDTASPNADATKPETMPGTKSTPLPGETVNRTAV